MTQLTDENIHTPLSEDTNDLQNLLDDAQSQQDTSTHDTTIQILEAKIKELENKLSETEQITKKAQSDYIHMKFDFDSYMRRNEEQAKNSKVDTLVDVVKKFRKKNAPLNTLPSDKKKTHQLIAIKKSDIDYEAEMLILQLELVKLQKYIQESGQKVLIIFEGRDAAGK